MKFSHFLILTLATFVPFCLQAQVIRCGTSIMQEQIKIHKPELYKQQQEFQKKITELIKEEKSKMRIAGVGSTSSGILTIPVVVHVIHNNSAGTIGGAKNTNISDAQILSQIEVLNEDYRRKPGTNGYNNNPIGADVEIEFCLASIDPNGNLTNGITRTYAPTLNWSMDPGSDSSLKKLAYWPSDQYLNIWVSQLAPDPSSGQLVLGYTQFPSNAPVPGLGGNEGGAKTDGVVIDYRFFGKGGTVTSSLYNLGRTTSHEVGHFLGLFHIWGDSYCGDDYVDDTPPDEKANSDYDCLDSSDCDGDGIYNQDLTNDYLDYSPDKCMNIFTQDQKLRMRTVLMNATRRATLNNSPACCVINNYAPYPLQEGFEDAGFLSHDWSIENNGSPTTWETTGPGAYGTSSSSIYISNTSCNPGDKDYLITPFLKFKGMNAYLDFDLAYAQDVSPGTDTLIISYTSNCRYWIPLDTLYGSNLITTSAVAHNFTPVASDWKKIRINMSSLDNIPAARLRFENHSAAKNNLFLDNINIYKTQPELTLNIFPNPAQNGVLKIETIFSGEQDVTYEIFDVLGQKVYESKDLSRTSYTKTIDVNNLTRAMYIVRVSIAGQHQIQKVLIDF